MNRSYDLLVFDWDGTVVDSEGDIVACMQGAMVSCGLAPATRDDVRNIIGLGLIDACQRLMPEFEPSMHERVVQAYRRHWLSAERGPALFPGVDVGLPALAEAGYTLAVATGKSRRGLDKGLDESGLRPVFADTRCADECASKPHPRMLLELMDVLGHAPARTLMIGDTEWDLLMARDAGCDSLAVSYGVHDRGRLQALGPRAVVDSFSDIPRWLGINLDTPETTI
ncbi:MAG: HAD family hydrolase [Gammaproteobacteria bacterium]